MIYRKLGKSDLNVSLLGYGAWAIGGEGWKDVDEKEAIETMEKSYECGVNFYDTAPVYGFGKSEMIIGKVFGGMRKNLIIATKCGLVWDESKNISNNLKKDSILREVEASLNRLKTDYIDLYQVHWPDPATPLKETFSVLNSLKEQKVIRYIGVSNFDVKLLSEAMEISEIVSVQNQYNMIQNSAEKELLPFCKESSIGFIAYSPLAQGLLSGKIDESYKLTDTDARRYNPLFNDAELFKKTLEYIKTLPKPLSHTAIKYLADREEVSSIIASATKLRHMTENIEAIEVLE